MATNLSKKTDEDYVEEVLSIDDPGLPTQFNRNVFCDEFIRTLLDGTWTVDLANYLKEDKDVLVESINTLTPLLFKRISERCLADKTNLSSLISGIKNLDIINLNKEGHISTNRIFDSLADRGMAILNAIFSKNLGLAVEELSEQSKLRDESDFSLLTIISSKLLDQISLELGESSNDAYEVLSLFSPGKVVKANTNIASNASGPHISIVPETSNMVASKSGKFALLAWLMPIALILFFSLNFLRESYESGQFSAVKFYDYTNEVAGNVKNGIWNPINKLLASSKKRFLILFNSRSQDQIGSLDSVLGDIDGNDELAGPISKIDFGLPEENAAKTALKADNHRELLKSRSVYPAESLERKIAEFVYGSEEKTGKFILDKVNFAFNQMELDEETKNKLKAISTILQAITVKSVDIVGHTDKLGVPTTNLRTSLERATVVRNELLRFGLDSSKVTARGVGGEESITDNNTPEGRLKNRRLELIITK